MVVVVTDEEARDDCTRFVAFAPGAGSLMLRRANVLAISDSGLTAEAHEPIRAGMRALPDRGAPLDELERQHWLLDDGRGYTFRARLVRDIIARDMLTGGQRRRVLERVAVT